MGSGMQVLCYQQVMHTYPLHPQVEIRSRHNVCYETYLLYYVGLGTYHAIAYSLPASRHGPCSCIHTDTPQPLVRQ